MTDTFIITAIMGAMFLMHNLYIRYQGYDDRIEARWRAWLQEVPPAPASPVDWDEFEARIQLHFDQGNDYVNENMKLATMKMCLPSKVQSESNCKHFRKQEFYTFTGYNTAETEWRCLDCNATLGHPSWTR